MKILLLLLLVLLTGCGRREVFPEPVPMAAAPQEAEMLQEAPEAPSYLVLEPEASGEMVTKNDVAEVDYSNAREGYVMVRYHGQTDKRLKVLLKGPATTYQYNLPQGQWAVFPLSDGNGKYQLGIYRNAGGNQYAAVMSSHFSVELADEFAPFLRPNQYVNYLDAPNTLALSGELCAGLEHPLEKVAAVYDYVVENLRYDDEKAATVKSGYLPVLDAVLEEKKGICFDYGALMAAMLRCQEVPCKLVVGYAGSVYHAWISVWTEEDGWVDGVIFFDGYAWKRMDPTFASSAEDKEEILDFIETGSYIAKYLY